MKKIISIALTLALIMLTGCDKPGIYRTPESDGESSEKSSASSSSSVASASSSSVRSGESSSESGGSSSESTVSSVPEESSVPYYKDLKEFDYEEYYNYHNGLMPGSDLGKFLDSLNKSEVKELYIRASALTNAFNGEQYVDLNGGNPAEVSIGGNIYEETGFSYDSFIAAMNGLFSEQATSDILANFPFLREHNGELYQLGTLFMPEFSVLHKEYQLVENLDDIVRFNVINYCTTRLYEEYDPAKKDSYEKKTLCVLIHKTNEGWRIEDFDMWGVKCARTGEYSEDVMEIDFYKDVPNNWIPVYTHTEAWENYDSIVHLQKDVNGEPVYGHIPEDIVKTLVNRNVLAFDISHGHGWSTEGSSGNGTAVEEVKSEHFNSLNEINGLFYGTYTKELADELLYRDGRPRFLEKDGKLCSDMSIYAIWVTMPFTYRTYIEVAESSANRIVFRWHYVDVGDGETGSRAAEMSFIAVKENDSWRLAKPVFDNPELNMIE